MLSKAIKQDRAKDDGEVRSKSPEPYDLDFGNPHLRGTLAIYIDRYVFTLH